MSGNALTRIARLLVPSFRKQVLPSNDVAVSSEPIAAVSNSTSPVVFEEWVDDSILRFLSEQSGNSYWIFSSDLKEIYSKLDAYNAEASDDRKINITLPRAVHDYLQDLVDRNFHTELPPPPSSGPVILEGDMVIRVIGPKEVGPLRMNTKDHYIDTYYSANAVNTKIFTVDANGRQKAFYFGQAPEATNGADFLPSLD